MLTSAVIWAAELLAVFLVVGLVTLAAGLWWLRRRVRRLKLPGRAAAARAGTAAAGAVAAGRYRAWSLPSPDRRWITAARERRRLWLAVGAAERSVAGAAAAMAWPAARHLAENAHREAQALAAGIAAARLAGERP